MMHKGMIKFSLQETHTKWKLELLLTLFSLSLSVRLIDDQSKMQGHRFFVYLQFLNAF